MGAFVGYIIIIIFFVIVKGLATQGKSKSPEERYQEAVRRYNANMAANSTQNAQTSQATANSGATSSRKTYPGTTSNQSGYVAASTSSQASYSSKASTSSASYTSKPGASTEQSTTSYLDEKAREDQREHAKEKREETMRVNKKYGNRPVAGRYLLGDPIPKNSKIVYCSYCGAENIVPLTYHGDKDCYFCRTHL